MITERESASSKLNITYCGFTEPVHERGRAVINLDETRRRNRADNIETMVLTLTWYAPVTFERRTRIYMAVPFCHLSHQT